MMIQRIHYHRGTGFTERETETKSFLPFLGHTAGLAFRLCVQFLGLQLREAPVLSFATSDLSTPEGTKLGEEMGEQIALQLHFLMLTASGNA